MAYEKQTWQTGDVVTSAKLNHMEDGIAEGGGGGAFIVTYTANDQMQLTNCDKTFAEIWAAVSGGQTVMACIEVEGSKMFFNISNARHEDENNGEVDFDQFTMSAWEGTTYLTGTLITHNVVGGVEDYQVTLTNAEIQNNS